MGKGVGERTSNEALATAGCTPSRTDGLYGMEAGPQGGIRLSRRRRREKALVVVGWRIFF
jgi:hypothetical protein